MDDKPIFAFVLMAFAPEFEDVYKLGIKEPAGQLGIVAERVDEQIYREGILERIYRQIDLADIIVADVTGQNPNVFYELGYAHAKGKLCIHLTSDVNDIPFDLKHKRHVVYGESIADLRGRLIEELTWAKDEIQGIRDSRIKAVLKSAYGNLERTSFQARGEIDFRIDLRNDSDRASAELESVYFYSGGGWTLYQDGQECASTESDIHGLPTRHFLKSPVRRLQPDSWAQIAFKAKKVLAWSFKGEELKDSYKISGRSNLRLITSEGNFDYEIPVDITVDDIPF